MRVPPAQRLGRPFSSVHTLARASRAHDLLADASHEFLQAPLVLVKFERHPRQRQTPTIAMARIEIDAIFFVRQCFRLHVEIHRPRVVARVKIP